MALNGARSVVVAAAGSILADTEEAVAAAHSALVARLRGKLTDATPRAVPKKKALARAATAPAALEREHDAMVPPADAAAPPPPPLALVIAAFTTHHDAALVGTRLRALLGPAPPFAGTTTCRGAAVSGHWVSGPPPPTVAVAGGGADANATPPEPYRSVALWGLHDPGGCYEVVSVPEGRAGVAPGAPCEPLRARLAAAKAAHAKLGEPAFAVLLGPPGGEEATLGDLAAALGDGVRVLGGSSADCHVRGRWAQVSSAGGAGGAGGATTGGVVASTAGLVVVVGWPSCEVTTALTSGFRPTPFAGTVAAVAPGNPRVVLSIDGGDGRGPRPAGEVYDQWTGGNLKRGLAYDPGTGLADVLARSSFTPLGEPLGGASGRWRVPVNTRNYF